MVKPSSTAARVSTNTILFPVKAVIGERLPEDGSDICPCVKGYVPPEAGEEGGSKPPAGGTEEEGDPEEKADENEGEKRGGLLDRIFD